ncbi:hypothetical protein FOZ60_000684 [Perkinsus olseni]|uniref:Uncharacterized protein n=1 Tax=Perkinsus olseni TaxID=32597 RepID=A0A7J6MXF2_PEROL|nr:hypothetical protein FOZ60_000684 [Perkinsus olseni]
MINYQITMMKMITMPTFEINGIMALRSGPPGSEGPGGTPRQCSAGRSCSSRRRDRCSGAVANWCSLEEIPMLISPEERPEVLMDMV